MSRIPPPSPRMAPTTPAPTEVKSIFSGRPILEIRSRDPVAVMRALDGMREVEKTSLFGTAVHAILRSDEIPATGIEEQLRTGGFPIDSIEPVAASLEDVFLDVVERASQTVPGRVDSGGRSGWAKPPGPT